MAAEDACLQQALVDIEPFVVCLTMKNNQAAKMAAELYGYMGSYKITVAPKLIGAAWNWSATESAAY